MAYRIQNNKLIDDAGDIEYHSTSKTSGKMKPSYLVLHYTAGANFKADVTTLSSSNVQASCHLVISKEGHVAQIGDFTDILWHAGVSHWKGLSGMNKYAIGIEVSCEGLVDFVRTEKDGSKTYRTWFGSELNTKTTPIIDAVHKNGGGMHGWVQFTPEQIEKVIEIGSLLMSHYDLKEAVGHDDIAKGRKTDPGPCMPDSVYARLNGRKDVTEQTSTKLQVYGTGKGGLNLRAWPDNKSQVIKVLKEGQQVEYIRNKDDWFFVNADGTQGWAYSHYLK